MSLMGLVFYIILTGFCILFFSFALFPKFYSYYLTLNFNNYSILIAALLITVLFLLLKVFIPEESVKNEIITVQEAKKAVKYLIAYAVIIVASIGFVALKYLRNSGK